MVRVHRQPGLARREARVGRIIPLVARPGVVAGEAVHHRQRLRGREPRVQRDAVLVLAGDVVDLGYVRVRRILHAQLLALVQEGNARKQEAQAAQQLFPRLAPALRRQEEGHAPRLVVVLDNVGEEADARHAAVGGEHGLLVLLHRHRRLVVPALFGLVDQSAGEVEHAGEAAPLADEQRELLVLFVEDLAHGKGVVGPEGLVRHLVEEARDALGLFQHPLDRAEAVVPVRGEIAEGQEFLDVDDRVDAEARHAPVQPPVDHVVDRAAQQRVLPVQVRLLLVEGVEIDLVRVARQQLPAGAAEVAAPVAGIGLALMPVADVKELPVGPVRVLAGLPEPFVLVGAVVHHQVHHDLQVPVLRGGQQAVHVLHRPEARVDVEIVRDVVALIRQGRAVDRREPDHVRAQGLHLVQTVDHAGQVPDPVAV